MRLTFAGWGSGGTGGSCEFSIIIRIKLFFFVAKLLETVEFMLKNYGMLFRCLILILRERFITCNSGSWVGRWPFSSLSGLPFLV